MNRADLYLLAQALTEIAKITADRGAAGSSVEYGIRAVLSELTQSRLNRIESALDLLNVELLGAIPPCRIDPVRTQSAELS